jgi:hypothetical protein
MSQRRMLATGGEPIVSLSLAARGWRAQRRGRVVRGGGGANLQYVSCGKVAAPPLCWQLHAA